MPYQSLSANYLNRKITVAKQQFPRPITKAEHRQRVKDDLRKLGVSKYGIMGMEGHYLPKIIHTDEVLGGVVYGHHEDGYVMLVATDRRIIFLDKKPFFVNEDIVTYDVVSGVQFFRGGIGTTVTLHTRIKDYTIRTFNSKCAEELVSFIEDRCLEHQRQGVNHEA